MYVNSDADTTRLATSAINFQTTEQVSIFIVFSNVLRCGGQLAV